MAKVTLNDSRRSYTEVVNLYISKGYLISPTTHGGTYPGERCHVHMTQVKYTYSENSGVLFLK